MRGNEARRQHPEIQSNEHPMESRIAVIENDIRNLKENVAKLFDGMKTANDAITKLLMGQAEMRGDINTLRAEMGTLRAEMKGGMQAMEAKFMRWFVATALSCAALAFSAAKLLN
jgi:septation ring formation regulator EzrA